jgi:hypothetical protein
MSGKCERGGSELAMVMLFGFEFTNALLPSYVLSSLKQFGEVIPLDTWLRANILFSLVFFTTQSFYNIFFYHRASHHTCGLCSYSFNGSMWWNGWFSS